MALCFPLLFLVITALTLEVFAHMPNETRKSVQHCPQKRAHAYAHLSKRSIVPRQMTASALESKQHGNLTYISRYEDEVQPPKKIQKRMLLPDHVRWAIYDVVRQWVATHSADRPAAQRAHEFYLLRDAAEGQVSPGATAGSVTQQLEQLEADMQSRASHGQPVDKKQARRLCALKIIQVALRNLERQGQSLHSTLADPMEGVNAHEVGLSRGVPKRKLEKRTPPSESAPTPERTHVTERQWHAIFEAAEHLVDLVGPLPRARRARSASVNTVASWAIEELRHLPSPRTASNMLRLHREANERVRMEMNAEGMQRMFGLKVLTAAFVHLEQSERHTRSAPTGRGHGSSVPDSRASYPW